VRGSPADSAGVRPGDVLLSVNGKPVKDPQVMLDLIAALAPEERAAFRLRRDKTIVECRSGSASGRPCAPNASKALAMCQLLGMNCNVPTDICFSFSGFQARGGATDVHSDGWGIAFFEGKGTRLFLDPQPSATSPVAELVRHYPIRSQRHRPHPQGDTGLGRSGKHPPVHARTVGALLDLRP
jgi:hypothetical protein